MSDTASELLVVANTPGLAESGGGHAAKGLDFQRWWAVFRMVEMELANQPDFLLLFETVQDVLELDSSVIPTHGRIYQVKKKDRGEWTWSALTGTKTPSIKSKSSAAKVSNPLFTKVAESALGKLQASLSSFNKLDVEAFFVSNAGCDFPLAAGGSAATSIPCSLADLAPTHAKLLSQALHSVSATENKYPDLTKLKLQKVAIHPDAPSSYVVKAALDLLSERSPLHAGQAASFAESLVMKISPLGRHTDTCSSFGELVKQRGFSRQEFSAALGALQTIPDHQAHLESWLMQLQNEGADFMLVTSVRMYATRIVREQLAGSGMATDQFNDFCDDWLDSNSPGPQIRPYCDLALAALKIKFSGFRDEEILARFLMRAIKKCVDPN
ncbi:dsDNA nuclease domain-containing protein [Marinobacter sp.]|uniref:dsDNA nuclease domain-containing protein n=1 Tax=Marinobacter sp. TaxID=50741 RepID=UPI003A92A6E1